MTIDLILSSSLDDLDHPQVGLIGMLRPRIKRTTEPIGSPDGDIYLMRPSADSDIRIEKPDAEERELLESLDWRAHARAAARAVRRRRRSTT